MPAHSIDPKSPMPFNDPRSPKLRLPQKQETFSLSPPSTPYLDPATPKTAVCRQELSGNFDIVYAEVLSSSDDEARFAVATQNSVEVLKMLQRVALTTISSNLAFEGGAPPRRPPPRFCRPLSRLPVRAPIRDTPPPLEAAGLPLPSAVTRAFSMPPMAMPPPKPRLALRTFSMAPRPCKVERAQSMPTWIQRQTPRIYVPLINPVLEMGE
eukprot:gb/GEZN01014335.1/.p1 GENE.gb/GEZN01014335.1/~~gb/GEZN01014335.1/.p1  ORF type:complete len:211 (-),score=14.47 gb/GEZN01014335.1/:218-850(-)